jgi:hypothetical protein
MTYVPDPRAYQQLVLGGATRTVDCTAWGAAFRVDAHTKGATKTTGRAVRLHSDEPVPDPNSPGLNLGQVDASVIDITNGKVNFDTRAQSRSLSRADTKFRIVDGRFCGLSVWRGVLVDRGFATGFRGSHDVTLFVRDTEPDQPLLFDSLVPTITRVSWDVAFDAAETLTGGRIYAQFTRDLTPDYHDLRTRAGGDRRGHRHRDQPRHLVRPAPDDRAGRADQRPRRRDPRADRPPERRRR